MTILPSPWPCVHVARDGRMVLDVLVAPNAKRTACMGLHDGALRIRLAAPPVDGAANDALLRWVAAELGLARSAVKLWRGGTSKRKQLSLDALPDRVDAWLTALLGDPASP